MDPDSEGDENFTHMVPIAPLNVFWTDPGDQVPWSTLGIRPISPPHLTQYSQDVASKFASAFMQAKNPEVMATAEVTVTVGPVGMATHLEEVTMEGDSSGKTKATEKCWIKSSMKEQPAPANNSHGEASTPAPVMKAGPVVSRRPEEMEATTDITTATGGGDASNKLPMDMQTLNQAREVVCSSTNPKFSMSVGCGWLRLLSRPCPSILPNFSSCSLHISLMSPMHLRPGVGKSH